MVRPADVNPAQLCEELLSGRYGATALFCMNDLLAVEILEGLHADQDRLPEGFSVVGFDDLPCAAMVSPRLSTIHVDREAVGRGAVHLLRQQLAGNDVVQELKIGLSWVEGGTLHAIR
jgi:DNA-binding LacI/PurR family transcriptional regulator